jgi:hypothetical protein
MSGDCEASHRKQALALAIAPGDRLVDLVGDRGRHLAQEHHPIDAREIRLSLLQRFRNQHVLSEVAGDHEHGLHPLGLRPKTVSCVKSRRLACSRSASSADWPFRTMRVVKPIAEMLRQALMTPVASGPLGGDTTKLNAVRPAQPMETSRTPRARQKRAAIGTTAT